MIQLFKHVLLGYLLCFATATIAAPMVDRWPVIAEAFFKDRQVIESTNQITITAPTQAEDATLVPIGIHLAQAHGFTKWYLFIDANPIVLTLTTQMPDTTHAFTLSTRI